MRGKPLFLECQRTDWMWAYVDGKCVGRTDQFTQNIFDLSDFSGRETFELVLAVRYYWNGTWGLTEPPKLVSAETVLRGKWFRKNPGLYNIRGKGGDNPDRVGTGPQSAPARRDNPQSSILWYRQTVEIRKPKGLAAPVYVELDDDWRTHAVIYWNGRPIGMYASVGPDRRFYIPEGFIRPGGNELAIAVDGYAENAKVGGIQMGTYQRNVELTLRLQRQEEKP
jgi:hypothetical protein